MSKRQAGVQITKDDYDKEIGSEEPTGTWQKADDAVLAQRNIRAASDVLKALVNDPDLPVGEETLVVPSDWMTDQPMRYDLREAIAVGIDPSGPRFAGPRPP